MKDKMVYLLYNTNSNGVKLHNRATTWLDEEKGNQERESIEKDMFTITYSPEDERKSTDIQIISKTKYKNRPKSLDVSYGQPQSKNVEGILIRKSSSLSNIEDLFLARRCPLIKPLLSESEIRRLQQLQQECRRMHYEYKRREESDSKEILTVTSLTSQDLKTYEETKKYPLLKTSAKHELQNISPSLDLTHTERLSLVKSDKGKSVKRETDYSATGKSSLRKAKPIVTKETKAETKQKRAKKLSAGRTEGKSKFKKSVNNKVNSPKQDNKIDRRDKNKIIEDKLTEKKKTMAQLPVKRNVMKRPAISKSQKLEDFSDSGEFEKKYPTDKSKSEHSQTKKVAVEKQDSKEFTFSATSKSNKSAKAKTEKTIKQGEAQSAADDRTSPSNKSSKEGKRKRSKDGVSNKVKSPRDTLLENYGRFQEPGSIKSRRKSKSPSLKPFSATSFSATSTVKKSESSSLHLSVSKTKGKVKEGITSRRSKKLSSLENMIHYVLSNPLFIKLGWTLPAVDRALLLVVTFNAVPASSRNYCFRNRDEVETKFYPSGDLAVKMEEDGRGKICYPSGSPAMILKRSNIGMRLTLYSDPKRDALIKDSFNARVIGLFDSFGNGVIYDSQGNKILNFNQLEGIFNDPGRKTVYKWRWDIYEVLEKQRVKELLRSMVINEPEPKSGKVKKIINSSVGTMKAVPEKKPEVDQIYENILAELPYPMPRKSKKTVRSPNTSFKTIILKINEEMALRINGQDNVVINFLSNKVSYRLDLGVVIDPETVIRIDELSPDKISEVPCIFNDSLNLSPSLQELQKNLLNPDLVNKRKSFLLKKFD